MREAVRNDRRLSAGEPPIEKDEEDRVWTWPDLVYTELIAMVLCTVILIVWSIGLEAPLEQPANNANTPNPSKAPWYFLGLQEMLVYFDPWLAGVVLPSLIIVGVDGDSVHRQEIPRATGITRSMNGVLKSRSFYLGLSCCGHPLSSWVTFLRGTNWNFFGPFEYWDIHKLEALTKCPAFGIHLGTMVGYGATRELVG